MNSGRIQDSETHSITSGLKKKCRELGFIASGIAQAGKLEKEGEAFGAWLERGYHAGMGWMNKNADSRVDPRVLMPGARSVITVALNYWHETPEQPVEARYGRISRYARGKDYHKVLGQKLRELRDWLAERVPGIEAKIYVDTGPVLEKAWAVRSGIGWLGKHTNVIRRNTGSWFFVGVMVVNIGLDYDEPAADYCGSCTACLDACPTNALQPYLLDASKCISYWTIEHRGEFSCDSLSSRFENWIFGCDICQEVCPWNGFATGTEIPEFSNLRFSVVRELKEWEDITEEEFMRTFRGTAVLRAKYRGFLRNVKNALRNATATERYPERRSRRRTGTQMIHTAKT